MLGPIYRWLAKRKLRVEFEAFRRRQSAEIALTKALAERAESEYQRCLQEFKEKQGKLVKRDIRALFHEGQTHEHNAEYLKRQAAEMENNLEAQRERLEYALKLEGDGETRGR